MRPLIFAAVVGFIVASLVPLPADAAFERVYAVPDQLEVGVPTSVDILFDTNDVLLGGYGPFPRTAGVYGFGSFTERVDGVYHLVPTLSTVGSLEFLSFSGPMIDTVSVCLSSTDFCLFLDDGSFSGDGIEGIGIPIGTASVIAHAPGDGLRMRMLFTEADFSSTKVDTILTSAPLPYQSQPVPEPSSQLLFLTGLGVAAWRMREAT